MNKKVFISMLILCVTFLVGLYILKIFFPQEFVIAVNNERLIEISKFIDEHKAIYYIFGGITAFFTYWLYCCACIHTYYLRWFECLEILGVVVVARILNFYDASFAGIINTCAFLFLPALMRADFDTTAIVYTVHGINQGLTLKIRNLTSYCNYLGSLNIFVLAFDMYLWLILFYLVCNQIKRY